MYILKYLLVILSLAICFGCGGGGDKPVVQSPSATTTLAKAPSQINWVYEPKAITLKIKADKDLNEYDQQPHTVMLCIYQLNDKKSFNRFAQDLAGVNKLLKCQTSESFVAEARHIFLQPGQTRNLTLDRVAEARFFGVVAGYYKARASKVTKLWEIPFRKIEKGMLFWKDVYYAPAKLKAKLILGPDSIQRSKE